MGDDRPLVIDADGHVIEPPDLWPQYLERRFHSRMPRRVRDDKGRLGYVVGDCRVMRTASALAVPRGDGQPGIRSGGWDPSARLVDMDSEGVDVAVLYPTLSFFFPEVSDSELHAALCRAYNDWLADYVKASPHRLLGVALLPLDDIEASIRELERASEKLGFRGAFARPNPYGGRPLQHPAYDPLWECAQSLGLPITVHEGISDTLPTLGRDRSESPVVQHLFSHPFEQMAACTAVVLGGIAERFPHLRFVFLESGSGWLPYWLDRMDGHWDVWREKLKAVEHRPSEIFRRQCFVSMDPDDALASVVAERVGDDVLVWASDYPHLDSPFPGAVDQTLDLLAALPEASRRRILGENALRLYGIERPDR